MKSTEASLDVRLNVDCPHCLAGIDVVNHFPFVVDIFSAWRDGRELSKPIVCDTCGERFTISRITLDY